MNDWRDSLQNFLNANPDLPAGEQQTQETMPQKTVSPKLDIILDRKGRKGKTATIITGFTEDMPDAEIAEIASAIKQKLATGGSSRGGEILIQGDRRADVVTVLRSMGYESRIMG